MLEQVQLATPFPAEAELARPVRWRALRALLRRPLSAIGAAIVLVFVFLAIFGPLLAPHDPTAIYYSAVLSPPSRDFPFGTDATGHDVLSRVLAGARISFTVSLVAVAIATVGGTVLGILAGYLGGWVGGLIMRVMDVLLAFPSLLLSIAIVAVLGPGLINALLAISFVSIPVYARIVRASVLQVKEQDFISASRALGASPLGTLVNHVMPNAITPLIVQGTLDIAGAILSAAALSFLGLGAQPPTPEWGLMLGEERNSVFNAPHLVMFPGIVIMITVLSFNLLGDGLRDALDPRLAQMGIKIK